MPIAFNCPNCGQEYKVPDEVAGRSTKCRKCASVIQIPMSQATPPAGNVPTVAIQQTPAAPVAGGFTAVPAPATPSAQGAGWKEHAQKLGAQAQKLGAHAQKLGEQAGPLVNRLKTVPPKILIPVAAGVLLVFCLLPTFLVARWLFGGSGALGPGERYLPADVKFVASVQFDQVMKSPLFNDLKKELPDMEKELDRKKDVLNKVRRVLAAGNFDSNDEPPFVVFELSSASSADEVKKVFEIKEMKEEQVGSYTMHRFPDTRESFELISAEVNGQPKPNLALRNAFCFPDKYLLIKGTADEVKKVLQRDKAPDWPKELLAAIKYTDMTRSFALAASHKGLPMPPGKAAEQFRKIADKLEYSTMSVNVGADLNIDSVTHCSDDPTAKELTDISRGMIALVKVTPIPKEVVDILDAVKIEQSGTDVKATMHLQHDVIIKGVRQLKGR